MRICSRGLNRLQVIDYEGSVRLCSWLRDGGIIGKLSEHSLQELWHGARANQIREQLSAGDYSNCDIDACPYLAMGRIKEHEIEISAVPDYPQELQLAFERVCNYACTSCTTARYMRGCDAKKAEEGYRIIEERIRPVLPHLRVIGANGLGELFCSKHTLKLLQEWRPVAPKEEIRVHLETNGSLFDAEHWKQIENLGQYHLSVFITIMSFDEHTYQILSGTKLPIAQIENNLRFVKGLREQGIINYLELATVVQERNFWQMPEFSRRCIEEFGADNVRLRPYEPWGAASQDVEWFTDIRGKYHPYHEEYREIMRHSIFKHPKVSDGSGGLDSERKELPSAIQLHNLNKRCRQHKVKIKILEKMLTESDWINSLNKLIKDKDIAIYGLGAIGKRLIEAVSDKSRIRCVLDKSVATEAFENIAVYHPEQTSDEIKALDVIVTPIFGTAAIMAYLQSNGYTGNLVDIREIMGVEAQCL